MSAKSSARIRKTPDKKTKRLQRWVRVWHYWMGALVSLQLLIWLGTGIYFNITPHEALKGMAYSHQAAHKDFNFSAADLISAKQVLADYPNQQQLALISLDSNPVYLLTKTTMRYKHACQQQTLINAYSGEVMNIEPSLATRLASDSYMGPGSVISVNKLKPPISEWPKQCNPLWQINMDDDLETRIYINAINGQLVGHKNSDTDLADLMFKLHFMDYLHQGSFNNPFSWFFGLMSLLLSLSGLYWVGENLVNKRYKLTRRLKVKS
ncbi:PepSY domain-containing protein [Shewanella sp. UCD-KL21]|uniref:PepSY domain-containing protein n=1 Tax=Shewanella sp. UCD-KL21 TaxID=1917164 RepID=UPI000970E511|nr:PepSY domain-containing protein [Shewanella sp. UCD-KL21]